MLELNSSLFLIPVLITILAVVLDRIFFRPIGRVMVERESKNQKDTQTLDTITGEIQSHTRSIEEKFQVARQEAAKIREELIRKGEETRRKMVEDAREESQKLLVEKMAEMDVQLEAAEKELGQQIHVFTQQIAESFL